MSEVSEVKDPSLRVAVQEIARLARENYDQSERNEKIFREEYDQSQGPVRSVARLWKNSGMAIWDDPPRRWTARDLVRWTQGNIRGRMVEAGNLSQLFRVLMHCAEELVDADFGPKPGIPSAYQVKEHAGHFYDHGMWIIAFSQGDPPTQWASMFGLRVADSGKIEYSSDGKEWLPLEPERENIKTCMPVTFFGEPSPWPKKEDDNNGH